MPKRAYSLYVSTFRDAADALRVGDDERLRALCSRVAGRGGIESTVSLMAMSDAERGVRPRSRSNITALFWCEAAAYDGGPRTPAGIMRGPARQQAA